MIKKKSFLLNVLVLISLIFILKYSFDLRGIGYDKIPDNYVILDERTNIWHGLSIRSSGIPSAWSGLGAYKGESSGGNVVNFNLSVVEDDLDKHPSITNFATFPKPIWILYPIDLGLERGVKHISFVQPYFDHPPFGALVLSSFVSPDVKTFTDLNPWEFRKGSLWMALLTGLLIFVLGWQIFKTPVIGLIATLIYSTVPTFLLLSRYALLENVLNPLMLMSLNLIIFAQNKLINHRLILFLAGIASGLAALTKATGWSVLIIGIILLRYFKFNIKDTLFFVIPSLLIGCLYFLWGLFLSPTLFFKVLYFQGIERGFIGSLNFLISATGIGILNFPFDGWWIGGFLCLGFILIKREHYLVAILALISLLTSLFLGAANYPWYFIPLIPFMCLSIAYFIYQLFQKPTFYNILLFFLVFFSSSFHWGYGVYKASLESTNYQHPFGLYRLFFLLFIVLGLTALPQSKALKYGWYIFLTLMVILVFKWNVQSFYFFLANWGKLPSLYTAGTF